MDVRQRAKGILSLGYAAAYAEMGEADKVSAHVKEAQFWIRLDAVQDLTGLSPARKIHDAAWDTCWITPDTSNAPID